MRFNRLYYRSRDLQKMRNCGVGTVLFKYDPDDVRQVWVKGTHGAFVAVPSEQKFHQAISFAEYAQMQDEVSTNTNKISDADLVRHYQLRDDIIGAAKERKGQHKKTGQGVRISSAGALKPVALNWLTSGGNDHEL